MYFSPISPARTEIYLSFDKASILSRKEAQLLFGDLEAPVAKHLLDSFQHGTIVLCSKMTKLVNFILFRYQAKKPETAASTMKLSRKGEYATKALLHLGACDPTQGVSATEIARLTQIPEPFLNQILLTLKNGGLLRSRRGAHGGYLLSKPPQDISIGEIARLMDGPLAPIPCASVTAYEPCPSCPEPEACKLRLLMREVRDAVSDILDNTSLADLMLKKTGKTDKQLGLDKQLVSVN